MWVNDKGLLLLHKSDRFAPSHTPSSPLLMSPLWMYYTRPLALWPFASALFATLPSQAAHYLSLLATNDLATGSRLLDVVPTLYETGQGQVCGWELFADTTNTQMYPGKCITRKKRNPASINYTPNAFATTNVKYQDDPGTLQRCVYASPAVRVLLSDLVS
ncbi:unnamed protein product [Rhizoctonia solani]|uniref:Uncharacterized protein n=1 Tax=Rhizoctonia solani TaxID=456999 RepID=A0A8H3E6E4_9AGAM|nr:unnamed protein product [Rhizoctonia solani]